MTPLPVPIRANDGYAKRCRFSVNREQNMAAAAHAPVCRLWCCIRVRWDTTWTPSRRVFSCVTCRSARTTCGTPPAAGYWYPSSRASRSKHLNSSLCHNIIQHEQRNSMLKSGQSDMVIVASNLLPLPQHSEQNFPPPIFPTIGRSRSPSDRMFLGPQEFSTEQNLYPFAVFAEHRHVADRYTTLRDHWSE